MRARSSSFSSRRESSRADERTMSRMSIVNRVLACAALGAATASCGDVVRNSRSPMILVIDSLTAARGNNPSQFFSFLLSDVIVNITTPAPCSSTTPCPTIFNDPGQAVLRIVPKDIGPVGTTVTPSTNNDVTIDRVHVSFRRADGRNTPGVDVPYAFDSATTGTVTASSTLTIGFNLVTHDAKQEPP